MQNSTKSSWLSPAQSSGEGNQDKPRSARYNPYTHRTPRNFLSFQPRSHALARARRSSCGATERGGSPPAPAEGRGPEPSWGRQFPAAGNGRRQRRERRRLCLVCQPRGSRRGGALPPPSGGCRLPLRKGREPRSGAPGHGSLAAVKVGGGGALPRIAPTHRRPRSSHPAPRLPSPRLTRPATPTAGGTGRPGLT